MVRHAPPVSLGRRVVPRQAGDCAQRGQVLDGLVGGPVLTQADRVVGPDIDRVDVHQAANRTAGRM